MVNQNKIFSFKIKRQAKNVLPRDVERTVKATLTQHSSSKTQSKNLNFTTLWANSAGDKMVICCFFFFFFFVFFPRKQDLTFDANCLHGKTGFDISCKLCPIETICVKCQILFSEKNKKNITIYRLLKTSPRVAIILGRNTLKIDRTNEKEWSMVKLSKC